MLIIGFILTYTPNIPIRVDTANNHTWNSFGFLISSFETLASGSTNFTILFNSVIFNSSAASYVIVDFAKFTITFCNLLSLFKFFSTSFAQFAQSKLLIFTLYFPICPPT